MFKDFVVPENQVDVTEMYIKISLPHINAFLGKTLTFILIYSRDFRKCIYNY